MLKTTAQTSVIVIGLAMGLASCVYTSERIELLGSSALVGEEIVEIVVRLRPEIAPAFHAGSSAQDTGESREVKAILKQFEVDLKPQHPGTSDPGLQSYFTIPGVSSDQAERLAAALREVDAVEAAYVQPPASPA